VARRIGAAVVVAVVALVAGCGGGRTSASRSTGCGAGGRGVVAGQQKVTIESQGSSRWYLRHVPPAYDGRHPVPLVVDLHGYSEGAQIHAAISGLGQFGDSHGFVTVTPQGSGRVPLWSTSPTSADMAFIGALLDQVETSLCVDTHRVYVTGLSNGAMMTSAVACRYSARVAAIATVAGITEISPCPLTRPVPVVAFHGTADPYLSYTGGLGPKALQLPAPDGSGKTLAQEGVKAGAIGGASVPEVTAHWAALDHCGTTPATRSIAADVTLLSFPCPKGVAVELYRVQGGGHTWPGSQVMAGLSGITGTTTMSISADAVMWSFFQAHPL
jgi:polyhydroxybutyrate depolymerase